MLRSTLVILVSSWSIKFSITDKNIANLVAKSCTDCGGHGGCDSAITLQGMTNGVRAFVMNKNPMFFLAHEQQTFYASTCTNAEFSYFMFVM